MLEALEDPESNGDRFVRHLAGSVVLAAVAQYTRSEDPVFRDIQSVMGGIKARVPGYSETLPARQNVWGDPIISGGGLGPDYISPIRVSRGGITPVEDEVQRLRLNISMPSD